ncbi:MAG: hypothetical protein K8M05_09160 [Deltaproteobacteria bacterium]|nr:hypothetical protein [Kofleriaceae bacterium]
MTRTADTTYNFAWDTGETAFFKFASNEWIGQSNPPDSWDADVDANGDLTAFISAQNYAHNTAQTVGMSVTVKAKFVIEDVIGSVDFVNETSYWEITGHVRFSASGLVSEGSCRTTSFVVVFNGGWNAGTDSSTFTIPSLSGSGAQACSTYASELNSDFALGGAGAKLHFNKFRITAI